MSTSYCLKESRREREEKDYSGLSFDKCMDGGT